MTNWLSPNPFGRRTANPAVTAKRIDEWFRDVSYEDAEVLAAHIRDARSHEEVDKAMDLFNEEVEGFGVEGIRGDYWVDSFYGDIVALYVNMGDTYNGTLLYETETGRFMLTTWGDWVEKNQRKYHIE